LTSLAVETSDKLNKFERIKAEKDGLAVLKDLPNFAQIGWEEIEESDRDYRLKWLGIFYDAVALTGWSIKQHSVTSFGRDCPALWR
jgi:ferredoxin-nitrite reductase